MDDGRRPPSPIPVPFPGPGPRLEGPLWLAAAALMWERLWRLAWPAASLVGLFVALALLGLPPMLPPALHALMLGVVLILLTLLLLPVVRRFRPPGRAEAQRRLELDNRLAHRPLATLEDHPAGAGNDPLTLALWQAHQSKLRGSLGRRLNIDWPRPGVPSLDQRGLRAIPVLLLAVAVAGDPGTWMDRLADSALPAWSITATTDEPGLRIDAWLTPPTYTGLPPVMLRSADNTDDRGRDGDGAIAGTPADTGTGTPADLRPSAPAGIRSGARANVVPAGAPSDTRAGANAGSAIRSGTGEPVGRPVPAGSILTAQVSGGVEDGPPPVLSADGKRVPFTASSEGRFQITRTIDAGTLITVERGGRQIAAWPITVLADRPPEIAFQDQPTATARATLRLAFTARDDYGVATVEAAITRPDPDREQARTPEAAMPKATLRDGDLKRADMNSGDRTNPDRTNGNDANRDGANGNGTISGAEDETDDALTPPLLLPLAEGGGVQPDLTGESFHDLSAHPWAGQPVRITLRARDAIGQLAESPPVSAVLPERRFTHPLAQKLVSIRQRLYRDGGRDDVRDQRDAGAVLRGLVAEIGVVSATVVATNEREAIPLTLALGLAARRLARGSDQRSRGEPWTAVVGEAGELLWQAALVLEDGDAAGAERALRSAAAALSEALARNASDAELRQLTAEFEAAMARYLDALEANQRANAQSADAANRTRGLPPTGSGGPQVVGRQDIARMLEGLRQSTELGARERARELLSALRNLTENLGPAQGDSRLAASLSDALEALNGVATQQQDLLDQTFRRAEERDRSGQGPDMGWGQPGPGQRGGRVQPSTRGSRRAEADGAADAGRQNGVRRSLGDVMRALGEATGEVPETLGEAERAMRDAERSLRNSDLHGATDAQGSALDAVRQGMSELETALAREQAKAGQGRGGQAPYGAAGAETPMLTESPDLRRARAVLEELRRRVGERERPTSERDYLQRLLRQF